MAVNWVYYVIGLMAVDWVLWMVVQMADCRAKALVVLGVGWTADEMTG